jgi:hypothetical protein
MKTRHLIEDEDVFDENEDVATKVVESQDVPTKRHIDDLAKMIGSVVPSSIDFSWTTEHVTIYFPTFFQDKSDAVLHIG